MCSDACSLSLPFHKWPKAVGELAPERIRIHVAVPACLIDRPCAYHINIQHHSILIVEPFKKIEIDHRLLFGASLVGVFYPGKVLRIGGRAFIGAGINLIVTGYNRLAGLT